MKIGHNIRQIRQAQNIEVSFMARELQVSNEEYEAVESDEQDITLSFLESISRLLSMEVVDLLTIDKHVTGIRNFFFNHNGNSGINIKVQGIDQEEVRAAYKDLYIEELKRIPKLEKLLKENNIEFDF